MNTIVRAAVWVALLKGVAAVVNALAVPVLAVVTLVVTVCLFGGLFVMAGDRIRLKHKELWRNGVEVAELGDNRDNSLESRYWGLMSERSGKEYNDERELERGR